MTALWQLRTNRWVQACIGGALAIAIFVWVLPQFAPYRDVWPQLQSLDRSVAIPLIVIGTLNLLAPAMSFRAALPSLRLKDAVITDWATTTLTNVIPGGSALAIGLTWSMLRSFGQQSHPIARAIAVTGVWDAFVKLGTPLIAIAWLATEQPVGPGLIQAAAVGAVLFAVAVCLMAVTLAGPTTARSVGRFVDRLPLLGRGWANRLDEMRRDTVEMLSGQWRPLTLWTVLGHFNLYVLLMLCLRAVGIDGATLGPARVLAAFAFGRLITALPITPGGLGVMEVGLVGALAAVGNGAEAQVVAAVLLFRFINFAVPLPLGALSWLWWSRSATGPRTAQPTVQTTGAQITASSSGAGRSPQR